MVSITLPQELEVAVTRRAAAQRTTPELLLLDDLNRLYAAPPDKSDEAGQTLAEYWADYIGSADSDETMAKETSFSQDTGRKFTELLLEKRREGRM